MHHKSDCIEKYQSICDLLSKTDGDDVKVLHVVSCNSQIMPLVNQNKMLTCQTKNPLSAQSLVI